MNFKTSPYGHMSYIISKGVIMKNLKLKEIFTPNTKNITKSSNNFYFVKEGLIEQDYINHPIWSRVLSEYNKFKFIIALACANESTGGSLLVKSSSMINCTDMHKLVVVLDRMDVGREIEKCEKSVILAIRDEDDNIIKKMKLTGLNGMNIRCELMIPYNIDKFTLEIESYINTEEDPKNKIPATVVAISNLWLEARTDGYINPNSSLN